MSYVKRIWNTAQHTQATQLTQAEIYALAKDQTTKCLREETRIRRDKNSPISDIKKKIDDPAFFIAAEADNAPLLAKKKTLVDQLEALNKAQKRSEYTAFKSQQYQEKCTKEFFSSFKGGFANSDVSCLFITPDWNNPASRDGTYTQ
jgi:hypothetical protein